MRVSMKSVVLAVAITACGLFASAAHADEIAYWNFNDFTGTDVTTAYSVDGGINAPTATMTSSFAAAGITHFGGSTVNAVTADAAAPGQALALVDQANNGSTLTFGASTANFSNIIVSFATQRTGTGFTGNQFAYSTDGTTFTNVTGTYVPAASFATQTFDLSAITGLNGNANATFRITFNGATSASGNNRIDNLRIMGSVPVIVPEAGTFTLIAPALGVLGAVVVRRRKNA